MLWDPEVRESDSDRDARLKKLLDDIFSHDKTTFMSLTAHGGAIRSILNVIGHREFGLQTGAVIPVLIRIETSTDAPEEPEEDLTIKIQGLN